MALTSDVERQGAAREALEVEAADKFASTQMSAPTGETEGYEPQPGITPVPEGRARQGPLYQSNLQHKTTEELHQGRQRLLELMEAPEPQESDQQTQAYERLLIRINSELQDRGEEI
jgi:hypothetical protein